MTDRSADEAEILDLIHRNRIAIWTQDFAAYEKCFVHADYTTRWNASRYNGLSVRQNWDDIAGRIKRLFEDQDFLNPANAHDTKVINLMLRVEGNIAWATFDQLYPSAVPQRGLPMAGPSREVRIFERHDGRWKIAFWGVMDASVAAPDAAVIHLDADCTVGWTSPAAAAALEIDEDLAIRAGKLRILDSRADQKLKSAVRWAAELDKGLFARHGALPIVLEAGEGLPAKVWWVIGDNGFVVFSLAARSLSKSRIDAAAVVFELSPAQAQLAGFIADGLTLAAIAERMGITANTARTHLDRVYEKVGVRTQPALVRVLLSTAAPV